MSKVEYAVLEKNFSPVFTGVYMHTKKQGNETKLSFVGTDSFILNQYTVLLDAPKDAEERGIILPKAASIDFHYIASFCIARDEQNILELQRSSNLVGCKFKVQDMEILTTSILIQGKFPDYENEKIMPKTYNTEIRVRASSLDKEIKKIGILTRDIKNFVALKVQGDILSLESGETDKGNATTSLPIVKTGDDVEVFISGKYLNEYIRAAGGDDIIIRIIDNVAPLVVINPEDEQYTCIIRPVQL